MPQLAQKFPETWAPHASHALGGGGAAGAAVTARVDEAKVRRRSFTVVASGPSETEISVPPGVRLRLTVTLAGRRV